MNRNIRQWWLPSLILLLAILLASLLLPNLIYPGNIERDIQQPGVVASTSTPTLQATPETGIISPATALSTPATPGTQLLPEQNCTYTIYFWGSHPDAWLAENILIGRFSYSKSEAIEILKTENQEVTTDLLKQFFAALLNSLKGVDTSSVDVTLVQASDWLGRHALGLEVSQVDQQNGAALAKTLAEFNNGLTGPGLCPDEPATPTPGPTDTPSPTETPTPTLVPTWRPFTSVPVPPTATEEKEDPTDEPSPSTEAPTEQPPTEPPPTDPPPTDEPEPTEPPPTEPPPTKEPLPTPTLAPEPTNQQTEVP